MHLSICLTYILSLEYIFSPSESSQLLLLLFLKKVFSARLRESDITPYQSEDPSPTIPTYRQK